MPRPDDAQLAAAAMAALGLRTLPGVDRRSVLHAAPGRCVERVELDGRAMVVKWRDDRREDREALLYRGLAPAALRALGAPALLGAVSRGATHLLFLAWVPGVPADWEQPGDVRRGFARLGLVHACSARLLASGPAALADAAARAELGAERRAPDPDDPLVLDPGDLHAGNFLLRPDGGVSLLDFENMAVRPRGLALRQLWTDPALPRGDLADLALAAYWRAAGWRDDARGFRARWREPAGGPPG